MTLPETVTVVVVQHHWWDAVTRRGVNAPITFTPLAAGPGATPNLVDVAARGWVKTRAWTARPDRHSGYLAVPLVASNDPDLTGFGGYRVSTPGEPDLTFTVDADTELVEADQRMVTALTQLDPPMPLQVGDEVAAAWLTDLAASSPAPAPPQLFFTAAQTTNLLAAGIDIHDDDPDAHPALRALIDSGGVPGYTHTQNAAAAVWVINHGLGRYPQVTVVDPSGVELHPDLAYTNADTVTVTHGSPRTGKAYLQ